jgi:competence protein ComEC
MGRGLAEEELQPPIDLRLVPMALAVWAGAVTGLSGAPWLWTAAFCCTALLFATALAPAIRRQVWSAGALAALGGAVAALLISVLHWHSAEQNPLTLAAVRGSFATAELTVTAAPRELPSPFPVTDLTSSGGGGEAATQWLVATRADRAIVADREFAPAMPVTVMAIGDRWAALVPGAQIRVGGLLAPDPYSVLPGVMLKARSAPIQVRPAPWWQGAASSVRDHLVRNASLLSKDAKGLLPGLVVGNTDGVTTELKADAKLTGLTHLLAVSGSHFALLCGLTVMLLRGGGPRFAAAGGAVVLLGLVILVGPGASVLRAAVMGSVALIAMSTGRNRTALPALATATIGLLLYDPTLSRSVGFALSVLATAGLILLAPVWSKALQRIGFPPGWAELLAVPAAAFVVTMPVIAALSGAISLASIPANLLAAPAVGPALVIGMGSALTAPWWPTAAAVLARADQPLLEWIAFVAHRLARWQAATLPWPASVPGVLALSGLVIAGLLILRRQRVRAVVLAVVVGAGIVLIPAQVISIGWPPPGWVLVACEVGQGDGMVLSTGEDGVGIVVDTGPDPALMDACLTRLHIATIPLLVLTHLHADHVDGLSGVLAGRTVGAIGVGPDRDAVAGWRTVTGLAAARGIPVVGLPKGTRWASGRLEFEVLGPEGAFRGTDSDENNDSVVLMAQVSGIRILMTGDVQNEAQQQLLDDGVDLRADVLEQPHHGSAKVLPAFVGAVRPDVSVIGVGRDNDYGQPSPKALAQLSGLGSAVLRTDLQGDAAVCVIDGRISTAIRGPSLPANSSKGGGTSDGS